jgi:hypothetical protein
MKWYIAFESDVPAVAIPAILAMIDRGSIAASRGQPSQCRIKLGMKWQSCSFEIIEGRK